jgi:pyruvate kinase
MDLPGPKLRTGPMALRPGVARWRVRRGSAGELLMPARVWPTPEGAPEPKPEAAQVSVPVPVEWLAGVRLGDALLVHDNRDKERHLRVVGEYGASRLAESEQGAYVAVGAPTRDDRPAADRPAPHATRVGALPDAEQVLVLRPGDLLDLTSPDVPGGPSEVDASGSIVQRNHIGCSEPTVFQDVRIGDGTWFDDGKIGGEVVRAAADSLHIRVTYADAAGSKLRADKGINLPESELRVPALGPNDLRCLDRRGPMCRPRRAFLCDRGGVWLRATRRGSG